MLFKSNLSCNFRVVKRYDSLHDIPIWWIASLCRITLKAFQPCSFTPIHEFLNRFAVVINHAILRFLEIVPFLLVLRLSSWQYYVLLKREIVEVLSSLLKFTAREACISSLGTHASGIVPWICSRPSVSLLVHLLFCR